MTRYSCEECGRATTNVYVETPATWDAPAETAALCEQCAQAEDERMAALESEAIDRLIDERQEEDDRMAALESDAIDRWIDEREEDACIPR